MDNCRQLNVTDKLVIRTHPDFRIYYVNDDFVKTTGIDADEALLKELTEILPYSMPDLFKEIIQQNVKDDERSYYIIKGKTKEGDCYWGLMRLTPFTSKLNGEKRFLVEVKMLPNNAVEEAAQVFSTIEKVHENAGKDFAMKYFEGYLEDRNVNFDEYIFKTLGVSKKKIDKYFELT